MTAMHAATPQPMKVPALRRPIGLAAERRAFAARGREVTQARAAARQFALAPRRARSF